MDVAVKPYLVRLTPLEAFFFGGERNFSALEQESYIVKSRLFPQQTALLGFMRMQLLLAKGLLSNPFSGAKLKSNQDAKVLIGEKSFRIGGANDFGSIKALSPVFLTKEDEYYFVAPKDYHYAGLQLLQDAKFCLIKKDGTHNKKDYALTIADYDPKEPHKLTLISNLGNSQEKENVFKSSDQVGITKNKKHYAFRQQAVINGEDSRDSISEEDGFFKQTKYRLSNGFSFGFVVWLDEKTAGDLLEYLAVNDKSWFGGERSAFAVSMRSIEEEELEEMAPQLSRSDPELTKLVLLSDAYVEPSVYDACFFAISDAVSFRFLRSDVSNTRHYYKRSRNESSTPGDLLQKSKKYNLLERGSVFYVRKGKEQALIERLKSAKNFLKIGYNAFLVCDHEKQHHFFYNPNQNA